MQKHSKKVLIVALDGLEYDLVEKFDLKNLKQVEYGKVDLSQFSVLSTPTIWASFITGLPPEKHEVKIGRVWNNPFVQLLYERFLLLSNNLGLQTITGGRGKTIFDLLRFKLKQHTLLIDPNKMTLHDKNRYRKRGIKTIFDIVDKSIPLDIPTYDTRDEFQGRLKDLRASLRSMGIMEGIELRHVIDNPRLEKSFEEKFIWKSFSSMRKRCFKALESDWRLIMAYFRYADPLGHLFRSDLTKMWEGYNMADEIIADLKSRVNEEDTLLLVVSDHGMKPLGRYGIHSDHAFYSTNKKLGLENPKITDFFHLILKWLWIRI